MNARKVKYSLLALAVMVGVLAGNIQSAFAHHTTIKPTVVCANAFTITWDIVNSENISGTAEVTTSAGTLSASNVVLPPNKGTVQVTTTHTQAEAVTLTVKGTWSNGVKNTSTAQVKKRDFPDCREDTQITVGQDCDSIDIGSEKDLSNIIVRYEDGHEAKFDNLTGLTWSLTVPDPEHGFITDVWVKSGNNKQIGDPRPVHYDSEGVGQHYPVTVPQDCEDDVVPVAPVVNNAECGILGTLPNGTEYATTFTAVAVDGVVVKYPLLVNGVPTAVVAEPGVPVGVPAGSVVTPWAEDLQGNLLVTFDPITGTDIVPCEEPTLEVEHTKSCGVIELTFYNNTPWTYAFEHRLADTIPTDEPYYPDNERYIVTSVPAGESRTVTVNFSEDDPNGWVEWRVRLGPESDLFVPDWQRITTETDCEPNEVDPNPVGTVELSCESGINVQYSVDALGDHQVADDVEFEVEVNGVIVKTETLSPGQAGNYTVANLNEFEDDNLTVKLYADGELIASDEKDVDCVEKPEPEVREDVVEKVDCETLLYVTTTTTYQRLPIWDAESGTYVLGEEEQIGEPVVTDRPASPEELEDAECARNPGDEQWWYTAACLTDGGINVVVALGNITDGSGYQEDVVYELRGETYTVKPGGLEYVIFQLEEDEGDGNVSFDLTIDGEVLENAIVVDTDCVTPPPPPPEEPEKPDYCPDSVEGNPEGIQDKSFFDDGTWVEKDGGVCTKVEPPADDDCPTGIMVDGVCTHPNTGSDSKRLASVAFAAIVFGAFLAFKARKSKYAIVG